MSKLVSEYALVFKERRLKPNYSVIFMSANHIPVKRRIASKETVYIVIGLRLDGSKKVLGFTIAPNESVYIWKEPLQDLKTHGLEEGLLVVTDGLSIIIDSIQSI